MRIAVISDLHGNLPALQAVLCAIEVQSADLTVCLGDLAVKGPAPAECIRLIRGMRLPCVHGNTDIALLQVAGRLPGGDAIPAAAIPYMEWHLGQLAPSDLDYLAGLPLSYRVEADGHVIQFVHGSPADCNAAIRPGQPAGRLLDEAAGDWVVMGHIHEPFAFRSSGRLLVNAGAVGFSLDGNWRPSYALLDTRLGTVHLQRVEYEISAAEALARERDFCISPDWYGQALRLGWWEPIPWDRRKAIDNFPR